MEGEIQASRTRWCGAGRPSGTAVRGAAVGLKCASRGRWGPRRPPCASCGRSSGTNGGSRSGSGRRSWGAGEGAPTSSPGPEGGAGSRHRNRRRCGSRSPLAGGSPCPTGAPVAGLGCAGRAPVLCPHLQQSSKACVPTELQLVPVICGSVMVSPLGMGSPLGVVGSLAGASSGAGGSGSAGGSASMRRP